MGRCLLLVAIVVVSLAAGGCAASSEGDATRPERSTAVVVDERLDQLEGTRGDNAWALEVSPGEPFDTCLRFTVDGADPMLPDGEYAGDGTTPIRTFPAVPDEPGCASVDANDPLFVVESGAADLAPLAWIAGLVVPEATRVDVAMTSGMTVRAHLDSGAFVAVFARKQTPRKVTAFNGDQVLMMCEIQDGLAPGC